jgi:RNA recognition motif-containing protein
VKLNLLRGQDGYHRGAGFVEFETPQQAEIALEELDELKYGSNILRIDYAKSLINR